MDKNMELLFSKLEEKLNQQTLAISTEVTKTVLQALDEKFKSIEEENKNLKTRITTLEQKIDYLEKDKRRNNLVFFGIEEKSKSEAELVDYIKEIVEDTGIHLESQEIANVYRIGQRSDKSRPVIVSFTTKWKKHLIQKNKSKFTQGIYFKEDYPKEVLEARKKLQPQLEEEQKKGNIAYLKYDKLVVRNPKDNNREKRKRDNSDSPTTPNHNKKQQITNTAEHRLSVGTNFDKSYSYRWRDLRKRTLDTCFRAERCVSRERLERGPLATRRRRHGLRAAASARGGSAQRGPRAGARAGGATDTYATGWLSRASAARPSCPRRTIYILIIV
ncbi:hypothetical protein MSG28_003513 [Choristoneura fumiferana]|uniref:Uncharacterized protein n=1 Tax=Choristoneura fumiferana TaxID=7141 RepID=A0ACC0KGE6_CHOFU|nr:hypothetical protein MSG28_003513 [Choristoneura fumiferana]